MYKKGLLRITKDTTIREFQGFLKLFSKRKTRYIFYYITVVDDKGQHLQYTKLVVLIVLIKDPLD